MRVPRNYSFVGEQIELSWSYNDQKSQSKPDYAPEKHPVSQLICDERPNQQQKQVLKAFKRVFEKNSLSYKCNALVHSEIQHWIQGKHARLFVFMRKSPLLM